MRAMAIVVHRVGFAGNDIDAVTVVHITVAIVIRAIGVAVQRVSEHIRCQIRVGVVNARINNGYDRVGAAGRQIPCLGRINVGVRRATGLPGFV